MAAPRNVTPDVSAQHERIAAGIQGQFSNFFGIHQTAAVPAFGIELYRFGGHLDALADIADFRASH